MTLLLGPFRPLQLQVIYHLPIRPADLSKLCASVAAIWHAATVIAICCWVAADVHVRMHSLQL